MSHRWVVALGLAVVLGTTLLLLGTRQWGLGQREGGGERFAFLLEDLYDRAAYQKRGRWLASGATPYLEEFSEYPQLTTWMMGLPYLLMDHRVERGEPYRTRRAASEFFLGAGIPKAEVEAVFDGLTAYGLEFSPSDFESGSDHPAAKAWRGLGQYPAVDRELARHHLTQLIWAYQRYHRELERNFDAYADLHHLWMGFLLALLVVVVAQNLRLLGAPPALVLLLLLPGTLYFAFNRHDVPVTLLVALAVHLQLRARWVAAGFVLGVAIMTKWYPLVLLPLFLSHGFWNAWAFGAGSRAFWQAFGRRVLLPGLAALGVILPLLFATYIWHGGGLDAVLNVFRWHAQVRLPNHASLLAILTSPEGWGTLPESSRAGLQRVFQVLQLAPAFVLALVPLRSRAAWLEAAILVTVGMVVFSKFFSPQWVLWIVALALLRVQERPIYLLLVLLLQVSIYVQLPLVYYWSIGEYGSTALSPEFRWASDARVLALFLVQLAALFGLIQALRRGGRDGAVGTAGTVNTRAEKGAPAQRGARAAG